jgi:hypothetical protein
LELSLGQADLPGLFGTAKVLKVVVTVDVNQIMIKITDRATVSDVLGRQSPV